MVANVALMTGVVEPSLFAAILVAVVLTTVVAPYPLAFSVPRAEAGASRRARSSTVPEGPDRGGRSPDDQLRRNNPRLFVFSAGALRRRPAERSSTSISGWYIRPIGVRSSHSRYSMSARAISPSDQAA